MKSYLVHEEIANGHVRRSLYNGNVELQQPTHLSDI